MITAVHLPFRDPSHFAGRYLEVNWAAESRAAGNVMTRKNGRQVYEEIHGIKPGIKALFTSGYAKDIVRNDQTYQRSFWGWVIFR